MQLQSQHTIVLPNIATLIKNQVQHYLRRKSTDSTGVQPTANDMLENYSAISPPDLVTILRNRNKTIPETLIGMGYFWHTVAFKAIAPSKNNSDLNEMDPALRRIQVPV